MSDGKVLQIRARMSQALLISQIQWQIFSTWTLTNTSIETFLGLSAAAGGSTLEHCSVVDAQIIVTRTVEHQHAIIQVLFPSQAIETLPVVRSDPRNAGSQGDEQGERQPSPLT